MPKKEVIKSIYKFDEKELVLAKDKVIEGCECDEVIVEEYSEIKKLGEEMIKLTVEKNGLGLAAPQVGVMRQMFVWMNGANSFQIVVNPKFFPDAKITNVVEGCLSYPGEHFYLKRAKSGRAVFEVLDPDDSTKLKKVFKRLSGERALVWQHELDHLNGVTIAPPTEPAIFNPFSIFF